MSNRVSLVPMLFTFAAAGCGLFTVKRDVNLTLTNVAREQAMFDVKIENSKGENIVQKSYFLSPAASGSVAASFSYSEIPAGSHLQVRWRLATTGLAQREEPVRIGKGDQAIEVAYQASGHSEVVGTPDALDQIKMIGAALGFTNSESAPPVSARLIDVAQRVGSLIVVRSDAGGTKELDRIPVIREVSIPVQDVIEQENGLTTTDAIGSSLNINVPLYADIKSALSQKGLYRVHWKLRGFRWTASTAFSDTMQAWPVERKTTVARALRMYKDAKVAAIGSMTVLTSFVMDYVRSNEITAGGDVALSSMVMGNVHYSSSFSELNEIQQTAQVYNIVPVELGSASDVADFLEGKKESVRETKSKDSVRDLKAMGLDVEPSRSEGLHNGAQH